MNGGPTVLVDQPDTGGGSVVLSIPVKLNLAQGSNSLTFSIDQTSKPAFTWATKFLIFDRLCWGSRQSSYLWAELSLTGLRGSSVLWLVYRSKVLEINYFYLTTLSGWKFFNVSCHGFCALFVGFKVLYYRRKAHKDWVCATCVRVHAPIVSGHVVKCSKLLLSRSEWYGWSLS